MAIDPRRLRPSELCRLLNSTPLGYCINERQLHRHRTRAGLRIGDGRYVDLVRYVAWLVQVRHTPKPEPDGDPYEKLKASARARNMALSLAGRGFLNRRVGHDERPTRLEPRGKVGGGAAKCEWRWDVNIDDGTAILTLGGLDRPTCHSQLNGVGSWHGQWFEHQRMPVEFIPLEG